jgi:hypothetical protein
VSRGCIRQFEEHTYSDAAPHPGKCDLVCFVRLGAAPSTCGPPAAQDNPAKQGPAAGAVKGNGVGTFRLVGKRVFLSAVSGHVGFPKIQPPREKH